MGTGVRLPGERAGPVSDPAHLRRVLNGTLSGNRAGTGAGRSAAHIETAHLPRSSTFATARLARDRTASGRAMEQKLLFTAQPADTR